MMQFGTTDVTQVGQRSLSTWTSDLSLAGSDSINPKGYPKAGPSRANEGPGSNYSEAVTGHRW
jgi:hypothetical protein